MKSRGKNLLILLAFLATFCAAQTEAHAQGSQASPMRAAAALPVTCKVGTAVQAADMIVVSGVAYLCTAMNVWSVVGPANGVDTTWSNNFRMKGPVPWADVTAFGAKPVGTTVYPSTTASCNGTKVIKLVAAIVNNGDGITIRGCGPASGMSTPPAPRVQGVEAIAGTSPNSSYPIVNSPTGTSTYVYAAVARDKYGALTAVSPSTTITNGLASLGEQSVAVSTLSRSNDVVTVVTTGAINLAVGAEIHLSGSTDASFSGWFNVQAVNNGKKTITLTETTQDTRAGATTSARGGTLSYYTANILSEVHHATNAYEYYICAKRPGDSSMHVIGVTAPDNNNPMGNWFYDYGATQLGNQTFPDYVTDTICTGSATNDPLTTTVVSGGGTVNIVVANAASQTTSDKVAMYDAAPNILAAANSISWSSPSVNGGSIYFPPVPASGQRQGYPINSYLKLPSNISILQSGMIILNETLELGVNTNWNGMWATTQPGSFAFMANATVDVYKASPGIYTNGAQSSIYEKLTVYSHGVNGGILWMSDDGYQLTWKDMSFDTNTSGSGDYFGMGLMLRSSTTGGNPYHFENVSFSGGPNQTTDASWAPLLYVPIHTASGHPLGGYDFLDMKSIFFNRRGMQIDSDGGTIGHVNIDWMYRQGGITPLVTIYNQDTGSTGLYDLSHIMQDTETSSTLANLQNPNFYATQLDVYLNHSQNASSETGGIPPAITGIRPHSVMINQSYVANPQIYGTGQSIFDTSGYSVNQLNISNVSTFKGVLSSSAAAPTISSGFGSSPSITSSNGTSAFIVNVGTGGTATKGIIAMPTAKTGWNCYVNNITASAGHRATNTRQTASATNTVTIENQMISTGGAVAWTASDLVHLTCFAY